MKPSPERILFVTGKLAEPSLRRMLAELAPCAGFEAEVAVLPITVAALLTTAWVARHLNAPTNVQRVILPGYCRGELAEIESPPSARVERGPRDLRDLPEYFGQRPGPPSDYGRFDIEILAEINHAPTISRAGLLAEARSLRAEGADVIDVGCDPGSAWPGVGDAVRALRDDGLRVSIDSFDPEEVESALAVGAELVLSVNSSNVERARSWAERFGVEVVAIPDTPSDAASLDRTIQRLDHDGVRFRLDPVLEPIGFGFAASLGRYLDVRKRYPNAGIMMGVANLTELTDADSAAINVLLLGFCQELGIRSVLTTQVINWCRTSVHELDRARRLVHHAVKKRVLPKHLEPDLVLLRDPRCYEMGDSALRELAERLTDRNYRLFAERGELHILNGSTHLHGTDPFALMAELERLDPKLTPAHAFYLGYELSKAVTALTLGKNYTQDQALRWGFLTLPERPHDAPPAAGQEGP
jgi:dihydropteroate synthase-like protein